MLQEMIDGSWRKMMEKQVNMGYISLHRYFRNTTSGTEVLVEHQPRVGRST